MAQIDRIPFNRPSFLGSESQMILDAVATGHLSGNGQFGKTCASALEAMTDAARALLTPSCTAALEMAALLTVLEPGDEVIMPSFTFVATATAVVLRGATPVFVDIREDTLNIDETLIESAITPRTRAIVVVHYAGIGCEMDPIMELADRYRLLVVEDAAQGILATYRERPLGGIGHLGALSFHETKNVHCGEGGALLINDQRFVERAEILQEKGTNRSRFLRGQVDKYTWVDLGSSFLISEVASAFLAAQLEGAETITRDRLHTWERYHEAFLPLEDAGLLRRPIIPAHCTHNGHIYYLLVDGISRRTACIEHLAAEGVHAVFHYVPLHSAPAGVRYGRVSGTLAVTDRTSAGLIRLPLWYGMSDAQVGHVIEATIDAVNTTCR